MIKALLFDLDGTLLHSDPLHFEVFAGLYAERGRELTEAGYLSDIHGRHNLDSFPELFPGEDAHALSDLKEARFRDRLVEGHAPMPGAVALLDRAEARGWRIAVVTNAPRVNAEAMLRAIGLRPRIELLVIGDECSRAKPDPEPYLAAMRAFDVAPRECLAFEDSPSGMRAAAASGAHTVGIRSSGLTVRQLQDAGAQTVVTDYTDPALAALLARLE
ncbi:HAD family hydrolase [Salipiger mangrovisoli]|uniref:HAD family phosphatase n=1 Tax=Salipiger mangrovisoli TaxID=2865933 RepID=A0ABR9WWI9_9RHOB|nr:HAD family phosphatase [Salipiger mangrovisoli]MBE9635652.1 HAD family phosphatase [Salipiger mangrovisoli]